MRRALLLSLLSLAACTGKIALPFTHGNPGSGGGDGAGGGTAEQPCVPSGDVTSAPMLRITRSQADNLVSDLLGAQFVPSSVLPNDEKLGPFAVNAITTMSADLAQQYQFVAESIGDEVEANVQQFAPCDTAQHTEDECARSFVRDFGQRAFRRPLGTDDETRWMNLYTLEKADTSYAGGVRAVVEGMLQSPDFLYRVEPLPAGVDPSTTEAYAVDGYALASRLSFLLWNSGPDQQLLDKAADGTLLMPDVLSAEASRMLSDPRGKNASRAFAEAWAGMEQLPAAASSPGRLGPLDPSLVPMMHDETVGFVDQVLRLENGQLTTLFQGHLSPADPVLASTVYGVTTAPDPNGDIALPADQRFGILSQASVLFTHAHSEQTSPVLRGRWVRETLFCEPVPDPPPTVVAVPPPPMPGQTTRQRFESHRTDPSCAGCHKLLDPVGFGFEAYDQYGRHRTTDNGQPVDDTGTLVGTDVDGDYSGLPGLSAKLAQSKLAQSCFSQQWYRFGLGHAEGTHDTCTVKAMTKAMSTDGFHQLVQTMIGSDAFTQRRSP
ncbi:MAG: DUF1588 domain-containing protein [Myxococcaceae bacterium]